MPARKPHRVDSGNIVTEYTSRLRKKNRKLKAQLDIAVEVLRKARVLLSGWREVVGEIDDMPKSEVLGKAMWVVLDQMDDWRKKADKALANIKAVK